MIKKFDNFVNERYDVDIEPIGVQDANEVLAQLRPGEAALVVTVQDEELLDDFLYAISKEFSPAMKDRFNRIFKVVAD